MRQWLRAGTVCLMASVSAEASEAWLDRDLASLDGEGSSGMEVFAPVLFGSSKGNDPDGPLSYCSTMSRAIPNQGGVLDDLVIMSEEAIVDLNVDVWIQHGARGDLEIALRNLDTGTRVRLINADGFCSFPDLNVTFDDEATQSLTGQCLIDVSGAFRPAGRLSDFDGELLGGTWQIDVFDAFGGPSGTLIQWCLTPETEPVLPDVTVAPTTLEFEETSPMMAAPSQTFSITNNTTDPIPFEIVYETGSPTEFPIIGMTSMSPLGGGETTMVEVGFEPEAVGDRAATLGFTTTNEVLAATTIMLSGKGIDRIFADGLESPPMPAQGER